MPGRHSLVQKLKRQKPSVLPPLKDPHTANQTDHNLYALELKEVELTPTIPKCCADCWVTLVMEASKVMPLIFFPGTVGPCPIRKEQNRLLSPPSWCVFRLLGAMVLSFELTDDVMTASHPLEARPKTKGNEGVGKVAALTSAKGQEHFLPYVLQAAKPLLNHMLKMSNAKNILWNNIHHTNFRLLFAPSLLLSPQLLREHREINIFFFLFLQLT